MTFPGARKLKHFIFLLFFIAFAVIAKQAYEFAKGNIFYPAVNNILKDYCRKNLKARFFSRRVRGNLLTVTQLEDIALEYFEGMPEGLKLQADKVKFIYTPVSLLMRKPRIEISGLQLCYGKITLPLKFSQQGEISMISFDKRYLYLNQIEPIPFLEQHIILKGLLETKGVLVLEEMKPKLFDIHIGSDNLEAVYGELLKAKISMNLSIKGEKSAPHLTGALEIAALEYTGDEYAFDYKQPALSKLFESFFVDIFIRGDNARIKNKSLNVLFDINLRLKTEPDSRPYLAGSLKSQKGQYTAYQNKFRITKGIVSFQGNHGKEALIDITAVTRVGRYKITALSSGTLKDSKLQLTSRPGLSRDEIMALLLFGKRTKDLQEAGTAALLLNKLFLGRAEAKISSIAGIDEFYVEPKISDEFRLPEVSAGKYLGGDKLYGSYKIDPGQKDREGSTQTVGGEYALNGNLKVKGQRSFINYGQLPREDRVEIEFSWKF